MIGEPQHHIGWGTAVRHGIVRRKGAWFARWTSLCLFLLAVAPFADGQQSAIATAAADLARAIIHTKQHSVAVLDFSGPGQEVTALGTQLADQLSDAIANADKHLHVKDRGQVTAIRDQNSYAPEIVLDLPTALLFAHDLAVQAVVTGELSLTPDGVLVVELRAYRVSNGRGIVGVRITMPITPEMGRLAAKPAVPRLDLVDFTQKPSPAESGYKPPQCIYCPRADYTPQAVKKQTQGTVVLSATIGVEGRPSDITIVKALPDGLTTNSIEALKTWRLRPAAAPDGKLVPCRERVEMSYEMSVENVKP